MCLQATGKCKTCFCTYTFLLSTRTVWPCVNKLTICLCRTFWHTSWNVC